MSTLQRTFREEELNTNNENTINDSEISGESGRFIAAKRDSDCESPVMQVTIQPVPYEVF